VPAGQLKARELEDRLEDLRTAVLTAIEAHEHGEPAERVFAELKRRLEHVPAGRWDPDLCIEKAHEWVELYGDPPAAIDWNPAGIKGRTVGEGRAERREEMLGRWLSGDWPSLATVQRLFGSWNAFLMEAGYPPRKPGDERPSDHQRRVGIGHLPEWTGWGIVSSYRRARACRRPSSPIARACRSSTSGSSSAGGRRTRACGCCWRWHGR
jgi:hypothetical protein